MSQTVEEEKLTKVKNQGKPAKAEESGGESCGRQR
jgi:hypothetical protein